jgi:cystathionine beta-lyase
MLHFQDCYDNLIVLTSASKSFNIAGLQNSFAVIPGASIRALFDEYTTKLHQKKGSSLGYFATQAAYENGEPWLEEAISYISQNEHILRKSLTDDLPGIRMSPLEGTYLCWIDLGVYVQAPDIERVVLDMAGLAVDFGHWFWPAGPLNDTHIRINIATSRSVVELAAEKLKQAIMRI